MIFVATTNKRLSLLRKIVTEIDDHAFIVVSENKQVVGGYTYSNIVNFSHVKFALLLTIYDKKMQNARCFVCGATGNVITFVKDYEKVSFVEALEILAKRSGIPYIF